MTSNEGAVFLTCAKNQNKLRKMADMLDSEQDIKSTFSSLGLQEWLVNQCKSVGIKRPSAIQHNCIPPILKGVFFHYFTCAGPATLPALNDCY